MIWYLLWLWWRSSPDVLVEWLKVFSYFWTGVCVVCFLTFTLIVAYRARQGEIQITSKPGPSDYPETYDPYPVVLREGSEVWIANGQEEQKFTLGRFKRMKDGKGYTIFAGKHSMTRREREKRGLRALGEIVEACESSLNSPPAPEEPTVAPL